MSSPPPHTSGISFCFGSHLGSILTHFGKQKRVCFQSGCGGSKKAPFPGGCLGPFGSFFSQITTLLLLYFQVFFHSAFFRSSWSFYAQAPRKWSQKEAKKDTLNQEKPDWATFVFWHTLQCICLILRVPEGSGGTLFPIVFPNSLWSMFPMLLSEIL